MSTRTRLTVSVLTLATVCLGSLCASAQPTVSFANDIQPIFDEHCTVACHNPDRPTGGLDLTPGASYANLVNQPTSPFCQLTVPDSVRVVPMDPVSSMIWLKTRPDDGRCGAPMPLGTEGLGILDPPDFEAIETWIAEGALDN